MKRLLVLIIAVISFGFYANAELNRTAVSISTNANAVFNKGGVTAETESRYTTSFTNNNSYPVRIVYTIYGFVRGKRMVLANGTIDRLDPGYVSRKSYDSTGYDDSFEVQMSVIRIS